MAGDFEDQLRAELAGIQAEVERLENKRRLIHELLSNESGSAAGAASAAKPTRRRAARRAGAPAKRTRRPRGLITGKVREFLGQQSEPVHATEILAFLEQNDAAPQSAKPMPTLQSTLQRMKEMGEIQNTGRNRWTLISGGSGGGEGSAAPVARSDGPPVVTSTTTFGARPLGNQ
ncbi:MAG: hypothetical protein OXI41_10135 [Chloroflexota bacterium]|nr:hypothetical protein [Chloroflexota bacterium]MDE2894776.1 hypothetical protein [Chloroflexota bacterium]